MDYFIPTKLEFGIDKINIIAKTVKEFGSSVLMVTQKWDENQKETFMFIKESLEKEGLKVALYDGVTPNPTTKEVMKASEIARKNNCEVVLPVGGGSTLDAGKAIAIASTHDLDISYYYFFSQNQPTEKTLPVVAVTSTSGTGSHITPFAVINNPDEKIKSVIVSDYIFPKVGIVDPKLMITLPSNLTALTGFDAFSHAFEALIHKKSNKIIETLALKALQLIVNNLEKTYLSGDSIELRENMAWADTLAGMCIANTGTLLPHALGQPISGLYPEVSHGATLAAVYIPFLNFTWQSSIEKFSMVARIFDPNLKGKMDEYCAEQLPKLVKQWMEGLGLTYNLEILGVKKEDIPNLVKRAKQFPDVKNSPKEPTDEELVDLYTKSYGLQD